MTRAVLYANSDMEPITVFDVPQWGMRMLWRGERVYFEVPQPISFNTMRPGVIQQNFHKVSIWGELFVRKGQQHLMLFTDNDEMALQLRADLLPGQRGRLQEEYRRGVADGFVKALRMIGDAS